MSECGKYDYETQSPRTLLGGTRCRIFRLLSIVPLDEQELQRTKSMREPDNPTEFYKFGQGSQNPKYARFDLAACQIWRVFSSHANFVKPVAPDYVCD